MWWMKLIKNNASKLHLWSFCILVVLSWSRYLLSGKLQVDEVVMESPFGIVISILFTVFTLGHFLAFYHLELNSQFQFRKAIIINIVAIFMLPCISNDIFSWMAYADSFQYNDDIYRNSISKDSSFYSYISELYKTIPNVYGVICLMLAKLSIVSTNILLNILCLKFFIAIIVSMVLYLYNRIKTIESNNLNFIFLNPLWTIQALGQTHTEIVGLFFIFLAFYFLFLGRYFNAIFLFSIAVLVKISFIFLFPVLIWYLWYRNIEKKETMLFLMYTIVIAGLTLTTIYLLFGSFDLILLPLATIDKLWPTGNFSDYLVSIYNLIFASNLELIPTVKLLVKISFLFYLSILLWKHKSNKNKIKWIEVFYFIFLAFLFLYSHRFLTWYLLLLLPIFIWISDSSVRNGFFFLSFFFTIQDIAHFNHSSYYYYSILVIGIAGAIVSQVTSLSQPFFGRDRLYQ